MCFHKDCSARCLVYAAGLHADYTVLNDINNTDAVFSAQRVELCDDLRYFHLFAVDALRNTCLKCHSYILSFIRGFLGRNAEYKEIVIVRLICRILQLKTFVADVPQVAVAAVAVLRIKGKINAVLLAVLDLILAGLHGPDICHTPRSDNLQIRSESFDTQFKTDLVISLSCGAVADRCGAFLAGDLYQPLRDDRTGHGCSEKVFVLVYSARLHAGHDVFVTEFVDDIFNI